MYFQQAISEIKKKTGFSNKELGEIVGASEGAVRSWLNGEKKPSAEVVLKYATHFQVSADYLLTGKETNQTIHTGNIQNESGSIGVIGQANAPVTIKNGIERELSKQEVDLLRIYNKVDGKKQLEIMNFIYKQDEC